MKKIPLVNSSKKATVDDHMYPLVSQFLWRWQLEDNVIAFLDGKPIRSDDKVVADIGGQVVGMGMLIMFPELAAGAGGAN